MVNTKRHPHHIRTATVSDVSGMFKVRISVGENIMTAEELQAAGITPDTIAQAVRRTPCAWVAVADDEVIGFSMVDLDSACLLALFVLPQHEGLGIGTELTRVCEQALFQRHASA